MTVSALLTVDEVAERLKCHPQTVRRWIWSGKLKHVKVGGLVRVSEEELVMFLQEGEGRLDSERPVGVAAFRAAMSNLSADVVPADVEELNRLIEEGEQSADWGSPIG